MFFNIVISSVRGVLLPQTEDLVWNTQISTLQATSSSILVSMFLCFMLDWALKLHFFILYLLTLASQISQAIPASNILLHNPWNIIHSCQLMSPMARNLSLLQWLNEIHIFGIAKLHTVENLFMVHTSLAIIKV